MYTRQWALDRRRKAFEEAVSDRKLHSLRKSWVTETGEVALTCRKTRYLTEELDHFKYRMIEMRLAVRDRIHAIAFFREWSLVEGFFPGHRHFIHEADSVTQQDYEMAEFVSGRWDEDDHPLEYGNIVLFDRLSIVEPNTITWPSLQAGIDRQFSKDASLMVLKAFPLEFEARCGDEPGRNTGELPEFARRQAAMRRLYRRQLGMSNSAGNDDWMWRVMRGPAVDFG